MLHALLVLLAAPAPTTAGDFLALSSVHLSLGDTRSAEQAARDGLAVHPDAHGFHLAIGRALEARSQVALAFYEYQWELFRAGAERDEGKLAARATVEIVSGRGPEVDEVRIVLNAVAAAGDDPAFARIALERVRKDRGDVFVLRLFLAEAMEAGGDAKGAAALYRALVAEDPRFVPALVALSALLEKEGAAKAAAQMLEKARAVDPRHWCLRGK